VAFRLLRSIQMPFNMSNNIHRFLAPKYLCLRTLPHLNLVCLFICLFLFVYLFICLFVYFFVCLFSFFFFFYFKLILIKISTLIVSFFLLECKTTASEQAPVESAADVELLPEHEPEQATRQDNIDEMEYDDTENMVHLQGILHLKHGLFARL
jgi:hypothetical protein